MLCRRALLGALALLLWVAPARAARLPGEFEPRQALLLPAPQLLDFHPRVLADVVAAARGHVRVIVLTATARDEIRVGELLEERELGADAVDFLRLPLHSMWLRDYGPLFVEDGRGRLRVVDGRYTGAEVHREDDAVPRVLARDWGLPLDPLPLVFEGGHLLSNGRGFLLGASSLPALNPGRTVAQVDQLLRERLGAVQRAWLRPLHGEPTLHIDIYCTFLRPDLLVVGRYDPQADPRNARLLDRAAAALDGQRITGGTLRVQRIAMPAHPDGIFRTYTNVILVNDLLLVPQYPTVCPDLDAEALALYRRLLPGHQVVGIDAESLIRRHGALHCIALAVPESATRLP